MEFYEGKLNKMVLRRPYNESLDLIIVLLVNGNKIKTVWLNSNKDAHQTLDVSKYEKTN